MFFFSSTVFKDRIALTIFSFGDKFLQFYLFLAKNFHMFPDNGSFPLLISICIPRVFLGKRKKMEEVLGNAKDAGQL